MRKARVVSPWEADREMTVTHINGQKVDAFTIARVTVRGAKDRNWTLWGDDNCQIAILIRTDTITVLE